MVGDLCLPHINQLVDILFADVVVIAMTLASVIIESLRAAFCEPGEVFER
ncbi:MAG: hypothetical protein WDO15_15320 [Bacteroidota bacterium]